MESNVFNDCIACKTLMSLFRLEQLTVTRPGWANQLSLIMSTKDPTRYVNRHLFPGSGTEPKAMMMDVQRPGFMCT
jgi:hypothetical protein